MGLADLAAYANTLTAITTGDVLEDAAIWRLLLACDRASDGDLSGWLTANADRFNMFDPDRPFAQHPGLAQATNNPQVFKPVTEFMLDAAGGGTPAFLDHRHNESGVRLTPAEAARLLLVRQQFSLGGIQSMASAGPLGTKVRHGTLAVAALRPFAMRHAATIADTLAVNRVDGPTGTFHYTWPEGAQPGQRPEQGGQVDALTWPARVAMLRQDADGMVDAMALGQGLAYGDGCDPALVPHATYQQPDEKKPLAAWKLYSPKSGGDPDLRPAWLQLLRAWSREKGWGILATDPRPGSEISLTGLRFFQSRFDGPGHAHLPEPVIDPGAVRQLDTALTESRHEMWGRLHAVQSTTSPMGRWAETHTPGDEVLLAAARPIIVDACAGDLPVDQAIAHLRGNASRLAANTSIPLTSRYPHAVATATRPRRPKETA